MSVQNHHRIVSAALPVFLSFWVSSCAVFDTKTDEFVKLVGASSEPNLTKDQRQRMQLEAVQFMTREQANLKFESGIALAARSKLVASVVGTEKNTLNTASQAIRREIESERSSRSILLRLVNQSKNVVSAFAQRHPKGSLVATEMNQDNANLKALIREAEDLARQIDKAAKLDKILPAISADNVIDIALYRKLEIIAAVFDLEPKLIRDKTLAIGSVDSRINMLCVDVLNSFESSLRNSLTLTEQRFKDGWGSPNFHSAITQNADQARDASMAYEEWNAKYGVECRNFDSFKLAGSKGNRAHSVKKASAVVKETANQLRNSLSKVMYYLSTERLKPVLVLLGTDEHRKLIERNWHVEGVRFSHKHFRLKDPEGTWSGELKQPRVFTEYLRRLTSRLGANSAVVVSLGEKGIASTVEEESEPVERTVTIGTKLIENPRREKIEEEIQDLQDQFDYNERLLDRSSAYGNSTTQFQSTLLMNLMLPKTRHENQMALLDQKKELIQQLRREPPLIEVPHRVEITREIVTTKITEMYEFDVSIYDFEFGEVYSGTSSPSTSTEVRWEKPYDDDPARNDLNIAAARKLEKALDEFKERTIELAIAADLKTSGIRRLIELH